MIRMSVYAFLFYLPPYAISLVLAHTVHLLFKKREHFSVNVSYYHIWSLELFLPQKDTDKSYTPWSTLQVHAPNVRLKIVDNKLLEKFPRSWVWQWIEALSHSEDFTSLYTSYSLKCLFILSDRHQMSCIIKHIQHVRVCGSTVTPGGSWKRELMRC